MPITVLCPFYIRDRDIRINCEALHAKLPDMQAKREYLRDYCARDWQACTFARTMSAYYDRAEGQ